jgi:hypothetical protein
MEPTNLIETIRAIKARATASMRVIIHTVMKSQKMSKKSLRQRWHVKSYLINMLKKSLLKLLALTSQKSNKSC